MKLKSLKIPFIIIAIGLIVAVAASLLTCVVKVPTVTEHDFPYSATYQLNGETKTVEGIFTARFRSSGNGTDPLERHYEGSYPSNPSEYHPSAHTVDRKDDLELCIVFNFSANYLLGDSENEAYEAAISTPYLAVFDKDGAEYDDPEMLAVFGAELISWEAPQPIENTFVFSRFSRLHDLSMLATLIVGLLVIVSSMIFVRKDKALSYKVLDKISIFFNFAVAIVAIPFSALVAWLMQLLVGGDELVYQLALCVPAITAFGVAASLSLRRKGFTQPGFFIQFVGPVLFVLLMILE